MFGRKKVETGPEINPETGLPIHPEGFYFVVEEHHTHENFSDDREEYHLRVRGGKNGEILVESFYIGRRRAYVNPGRILEYALDILSRSLVEIRNLKLDEENVKYIGQFPPNSIG